MSKTTAILLSALLVVALLPTQGCMKCADNLAKKATEKAVETAIEKSTGGKVDLGSNVDLTGLPAELIYPGSKAISRWSMNGDDGTGTSYVFETANPVATVVAHFKSAMAGWKNAATMEANDAVMLTYQTADESRTAIIVIAPRKEGGGGSTVSVTYTTKK